MHTLSKDTDAVANTPVNHNFFMQVVKRLQNDVNSNAYRQFAYALLDKTQAANFLGGAPSAIALPKGSNSMIVILGWDDHMKGWHVAGLRNPSKYAIKAMRKLGDALGILAARTAGEPARLEAALQYLLNLESGQQAMIRLAPVLADALTQSALAATDPAAGATQH